MYINKSKARNRFVRLDVTGVWSVTWPRLIKSCKLWRHY